uniref:Septin n=1 Tax=Parastrongyloides trichosuri TaxID=131310 RepID=A0A0N5A2M2_PARTI
MTNRSESTRLPTDYIGIADYKNQLFRRFHKYGLEFNIMVVGETGLGKSTFINNLFLSNVDNIKPIVVSKSIEEKSFIVVEKNSHVKITLANTPGFGNDLNNCYCWRPLIQYIDQKNAEYLLNELKINRSKRLPDSRIHVCLYFITPTGHNLKELDKKCLKKLHDKVNVIPIIAKADTLTKDELHKFKENIIHELVKEEIKIYNFPESNPDKNMTSNRTPYAIVCSNNVITKDNGTKVRIREYPWGVVEVDNMNHNDFCALRDDLLKKYMIDLISDTTNVHYENYRYTQLSEIIEKGDGEGSLVRYLDFDTKINKDFDEIIKKKEKVFEESVKKRIAIIEEKEKSLDYTIEQKQRVLNDKKRILENLINEYSRSMEGTLTLCNSHKNTPLSKRPSTIQEAKKSIRDIIKRQGSSIF